MSGNTGLTAAISRSITFGESERSRAETRGEESFGIVKRNPGRRELTFTAILGDDDAAIRKGKFEPHQESCINKFPEEHRKF